MDMNPFVKSRKKSASQIIIAYTVMICPVYKLIHDMLEQAMERLQSGDQVILHSDQGWHYQMKKYQRTLKQH
ncbi:IS3-like element ISEnfa3 family transposase, partial [Viridibacillus sp. NPDC093762]